MMRRMAMPDGRGWRWVWVSGQHVDQLCWFRVRNPGNFDKLTARRPPEIVWLAKRFRAKVPSTRNIRTIITDDGFAHSYRKALVMGRIHVPYITSSRKQDEMNCRQVTIPSLYSPTMTTRQY